MMEKISIVEFAALLSAKNGMPRHKAADLVSSMFDVIQNALEREGTVKIKGLGTFKIIDVEARESVNVNTGERVLIEKHGKITFTPDSAMKELVNKPFSQFETVILNEGVDFDEEMSEEVPEIEAEDAPQPEPIMLFVMEEPEEQEESPIDDIPVEVPSEEVSDVEETPAEIPEEDISEKEDDAFVEVPVEKIPDEEVIPTVYEEETSEEETSEEETSEEESSEGDSSEETISAEEESEILPDDDDERHYGWLWWLLLGVAACAVSFYLGYLYGQMNTDEENIQGNVVEKAVVEPQVQKEPKVVLTDTVKDDTAKKAENQSPVLEKPKEATKPAAEVQKEDPKPVVKDIPKPEENNTSTVLDKYEKADIRVRTGAYRITGMAQEITVRAGDTMEKISKRYLGDGMVCYMSVYNGLTDNTPLKEGQKLRVPQLILKKKLKKK